MLDLYDIVCQALSNELEERLKEKFDSVTVKQEKVLQNNDVYMDALKVMIPEWKMEPRVYLEPLYEQLLAGGTVENLITQVLNTVNRDLAMMNEYKQVITKGNVEERIIYRLISKKSNKEFLKQVPWVPFLDMALVFWIYLGEEEERELCRLIKYENLKGIGLEKDQLYELARKNTPKLRPFVFSSIYDTLGYNVPAEIETGAQMYMLSSGDYCAGATCLAYDGVLKTISYQINPSGTDLLIIPSSTDEVLIVADEHDASRYLLFHQMVEYTNRTEVPANMVLSNNLYLYSSEKDEIRLWKQEER